MMDYKKIGEPTIVLVNGKYVLGLLIEVKGSLFYADVILQREHQTELTKLLQTMNETRARGYDMFMASNMARSYVKQQIGNTYLVGSRLLIDFKQVAVDRDTLYQTLSDNLQGCSLVTPNQQFNVGDAGDDSFMQMKTTQVPLQHSKMNINLKPLKDKVNINTQAETNSNYSIPRADLDTLAIAWVGHGFRLVSIRLSADNTRTYYNIGMGNEHAFVVNQMLWDMSRYKDNTTGVSKALSKAVIEYVKINYDNSFIIGNKIDEPCLIHSSFVSAKEAYLRSWLEYKISESKKVQNDEWVNNWLPIETKNESKRKVEVVKPRKPNIESDNGSGMYYNIDIGMVTSLDITKGTDNLGNTKQKRKVMSPQIVKPMDKCIVEKITIPSDSELYKITTITDDDAICRVILMSKLTETIDHVLSSPTYKTFSHNPLIIIECDKYIYKILSPSGTNDITLNDDIRCKLALVEPEEHYNGIEMCIKVILATTEVETYTGEVKYDDPLKQDSSVAKPPMLVITTDVLKIDRDKLMHDINKKLTKVLAGPGYKRVKAPFNITLVAPQVIKDTLCGTGTSRLFLDNRLVANVLVNKYLWLGDKAAIHLYIDKTDLK